MTVIIARPFTSIILHIILQRKYEKTKEIKILTYGFSLFGILMEKKRIHLTDPNYTVSSGEGSHIVNFKCIWILANLGFRFILEKHIFVDEFINF